LHIKILVILTKLSVYIFSGNDYLEDDFCNSALPAPPDERYVQQNPDEHYKIPKSNAEKV